MLMIRFQRIGRKNDAAFRIAVLEKTAGPKAGKYVDLVGTYNPKTKATTLNAENIKKWMSSGAQVSPSVHNLLVKNGVIDAPKTAKVVSEKELGKNIAKKKAEEEAAALKAKEDAEKAAQAEKEAAEKAAEEANASAEEAAPETGDTVETTETPEAAPEEEPAPAAA